MSTIKPIPLNLLIHSIDYEAVNDGDGWSDQPGYDAPVTIDNVRFEYGSEFSRSGNADNVMYKAQVFVDMRNSKPIPDFVENSRVTVDGETMYIKEIEKVYGLSLHHIVLRLV